MPDKTPDDHPGQQNPAAGVWAEVLSSPEARKGVGDFLAALPSVLTQLTASSTEKTKAEAERRKAEIDTQAKTVRYTTYGVLTATLVAVGVLLIATYYLAIADKISGEAVTFLLGTLVGSAFGILGRFFPRS